VSIAARANTVVDAALRRWLAAPLALRWLAVAATVGALWWSSSQSPRPSEPSVVGGLLHNSMHVVAYAVVGAAVWCALHAPRHARQRTAAVAAVVFAMVYGVVDELHQGSVPGRVVSAWDVLSDTCGALLGVWLLHRRLVVPRIGLAHGACALAASCVSVALATFW
jgi:VanZ family protein